MDIATANGAPRAIETLEDKMHPQSVLKLRRRSVLASIGGAALGAVSLAYPGLARAVAPDAPPVAPTSTPNLRDPGFTGGQVQLKMADGLIITNPEYSRLIRVPPGKTIWKEVDVSIDAVNVGDRVMARGEPRPDGSLLAKPGWIWVNIATWHGVVTARRPEGVVAKRARGGIERALVFSPRLEVISGKDLRLIPEGSGALHVGAQIGAVGLAMPDGSLRATRIWVDS